MVFISGTTSTEVNKGMLLSEVRVATVPMCKSSFKGVWVEGEVYHFWKYVYGVRKYKSWYIYIYIYPFICMFLTEAACC